MRTPVRLAATLLKSQAAAPFRKGASPIYRWAIKCGESRLVFSNRPALSSRGEEKKAAKAAAAQRTKAMRAAPWAKSPIVWLTGASEVLEQSITPGLARMLQECERTVFLETDGFHLRKRIHEFRPDSRLYLTVRLYGMPEKHDARTQRPAAFARAVEGISAAQLSGFLICAHIVIEAATQKQDIDRLFEYLHSLRVDGVIISATEDHDSASTRETLSHCLRLLRNSWWTKFSRLVQDSFQSARRQAVAVTDPRHALPASQFPSAAGLNPSRTCAIAGEEAAAQ
jgi:hypothetical protein